MLPRPLFFFGGEMVSKVAPRIDVHVHLGGLGNGPSGISLSRRFRRGFVFRAILHQLQLKKHEWPQADDLYAERLAAMVREAKSVDQAVALALDGRYRDGELDRENSAMVVPNDWCLEVTRRHPELLFGASINPLREDALDELDKVCDQGAVLCKWLPNIMGFVPDDARLKPFYRKLAKRGLPLLSHCGAEFTLPGGVHAHGDPLRLRKALEEGVTVIAAHCGTLAPVWVPGEGLVGGPERLARMMEEFPRLHADLAALTSILRGFLLSNVLKDDRLRGRIVDATDFPVPCMPFTQIGRVPFGSIMESRRISNCFDQDRFLKDAAGMPPEAIHRAAGLLRIGDRAR
jgi:predicted TIM-barrel fold metal-dependent hydrolase